MKLSKHISHKKGFTLIELLIVIGILGILAAGLLAAIDPLEQLKRGRDTQRRNVTVELNNALLRYYAVQGSMPWGTTLTNVALSSITNTVIGTLITSGELKSSFSIGVRNIGGDIRVVGNSDDIYTCFNPESKSIRSDPSTVYGAVSAGSATLPTTAAGCPGSSTCVFCVH
jgi:prepilin-type N-terminal cleavage/methylation domain-containing protein